LRLFKLLLLFPFGLLLFLFGGYVVAALVAVNFPVDGRAQVDAEGEPAVFVCADAAHADILLPSRDPLIDWTTVFGGFVGSDLPVETYLSIGWGDLVFFNEIPTWGDVRPHTVAFALAGFHPTAIRVVAVKPPNQLSDCRRLLVDSGGRKAIINYIIGTLQLNSLGQAKKQLGGSRYEAYFLAHGSYSPLRTCNQWASGALSAAGLRHAKFAPFSFGVVWPLEKGN
jgi:uncharacterized protein (TIGR02117 family)